MLELAEQGVLEAAAQNEYGEDSYKNK